MSRVIIKASEAKKGLVAGTGPGTRHTSFNASKFSKEFVLKDGTFLMSQVVIGARPGDKVVFAYS